MSLGRYISRLVLLCLGTVLVCAPVQAQAVVKSCRALPGSVTLPAVGSFDLKSTGHSGLLESGFSCATNGVLTLLGINFINATLLSAQHVQSNQPRLLNATSGEYIPFRICKDAACANPMSFGGSVSWAHATLLGLLGLFTGPGGTMPLYLQLLPGANVSAGVYTGWIRVKWDWSLCMAGALFICAYEIADDESLLNISVTVTNQCSVNATPVNFGSGALITSFAPVTGGISVLCTKNAPYTVGISDGLYGSGGVRMMANGSERLAYDIYYPANGNSRWGAVGAERRANTQATVGAGLPNGEQTQNFTFRAEILRNQPSPTDGIYKDSLIVDVEF